MHIIEVNYIEDYLSILYLKYLDLSLKLNQTKKLKKLTILLALAIMYCFPLPQEAPMKDGRVYSDVTRAFRNSQFLKNRCL